MDVSRVFLECFKKVTRKIEGRFEEVLRLFQGSFKGVS